MSADHQLEEARMHARGLARRMADAGFHLDVGDARVRTAAELAARAAGELRDASATRSADAHPSANGAAAALIDLLRDELACASESFASAREPLRGANRRPTHSPSDW